VSSTYRLKPSGNTLFDRLVALEELALEAGFHKQGYGKNHTKEWLTTYKTKVQLGIL
jgi:hypothetical protein